MTEYRVAKRITGRTIAILAASVLLLGVVYVVARLTTQVGALSAALDAQRAQAVSAGITPTAPPARDIVRDPNTAPDQIGPQGERGDRGPGPTDAQVAAVVDAYFRAHPPPAGRAPTPGEIAAAVVNYLRSNPPAAGAAGPRGDTGPGPTAEQIAAAVADYLDTHPPPAGPQGDQGRPPTEEELAAAVRAYIEAHPLPTCPDGFQPSAETVLTNRGPVEASICVKS